MFVNCVDVLHLLHEIGDRGKARVTFASAQSISERDPVDHL